MTASRVLELLWAAPARLGDTRLLAIDGPAGSGKTTLARAVADRLDAPLVRMDDLYPGWDGLFAVSEEVLALLTPLASRRTGSYRRYDWGVGAYRETHHVEPVPVLVLEGVGAGNRAWSDWISVLVWVEAGSRDERLRRGLERDGAHARAHLERWMVDEQRLFAEEGTRDRADLVVRT